MLGDGDGRQRKWFLMTAQGGSTKGGGLSLTMPPLNTKSWSVVRVHGHLAICNLLFDDPSVHWPAKHVTGLYNGFYDRGFF